jgi:hypothetical protein
MSDQEILERENTYAKGDRFLNFGDDLWIKVGDAKKALAAVRTEERMELDVVRDAYQGLNMANVEEKQLLRALLDFYHVDDIGIGKMTQEEFYSIPRRATVLPKIAEGGMPRRCRLDLITEGELAIVAAVQAVEKMGAHVLLTDAVMLLDEARSRVADFVELP